MSRQISSIKCELQNIYIKQEHNIDESIECNDSNDGEFTYQCYRTVQDSKYTTENVETQIKTEVNIIDGVIYESFFKRENYNYDPSINMCQMPTTYCIKIEPTNCNLNTKASIINLTPPKHKTALYKKKQYFSQIGIKSEKPYKCGICNKSFSLKGTLKTHLSIHMKDKPYKCFICNKSFSQASTLITHKVTHNSEKPFNCDICKKSFAQKVNMKTHMMFHMGDKSNKKTCNKTISLKEFYTKTLTDEKPYKSVIYNKLLSEGTTLSVKQQFKCHICCKSFYYKGSLKTHLITHMKEKPYKCHICSKSYSQKGNLKTHLITHMKEKPYKCHICSKSYSQKGYMKIHMEFHMGEKSNNKTCNKTISLKEFHTKTLTDENPYKSVICNKLLSEETTLSVKQQFKCHVCSKSFSYKATLKTHLIIHTEEKPHKCHICSKSFYYKGNLKTHLIIHMKEKPYKCHICSKSYSQKGYMKIHMEFHMGEKSNNKTISLKEFHTKTLTDENPYKSVICNKLLSGETTLSVKQQFKCHVCSKSFSYKATLKTHLIIHTEEKPHKCHICSKSFYYKGNLKTHLIIHMKEKPYKCHICSKSYSQKGNLKIHTRIHTRENP